ncbi:MAG: TraR/DksA C4-type zinc finger protein [Opitutaceae bacterium]|jgi:RNA polymerase-binding transcription factor DksA
MAKNKKPVSAKKHVKSVPARKPAPAAKKASAGKTRSAAGKPVNPNDLKRRILERKIAKPIAFSLDEVREIAKRNAKKTARAGTAAGKPARDAIKADLPVKGASRPSIPHHIKAASLADILGFNPSKAGKSSVDNGDSSDVPERYRRYYKLLVDLRSHVLESLGQHSEETLKRSAKEDAGDLSGYGQHMADAGTDTFDRDFALSLVSSEQEALSEVEAAIKRIREGTYGICELTGKPISRDRLLAVPFTRYSAEAQKELEKTKHYSVQRAGIFADTTSEEGGKLIEEEPEE